jgi:hypothetical protein
LRHFDITESAKMRIDLTRHRNLLVTSLLVALGLSSAEVHAGSAFVTNCNDSGTGSLRAAAGFAGSGDVIDLTQLTTNSVGCANSTISLTTGEIVLNQSVITVAGPVSPRITVTNGCSATSNCRLLHHLGSALYVNNLTLSNGYYAGNGAYGGCIFGAGLVQLTSSTVEGCHLVGSYAFGGGVYAPNVSLFYSQVINNTAATYNLSQEKAVGGGIYANTVAMHSSIVSGNAANQSRDFGLDSAGGVRAQTLIKLFNSTVSGNTSGNFAGISGAEALIYNSTVAGNHAIGGAIGGIFLTGPATIANSTIAFNTSVETLPAGLYSRGSNLSLVSNMIANNTSGGGTNNDFGANVSGGTSVTGNHNFIRVPTSTVPSDTIVGSCPFLGSLRYNGGLTPTIALESKSPGIDQGINSFDLPEDERGKSLDKSPFLYPRVSGAAADIGAYEVQQTEIIFTANFEGCL